MRKILYLLTNAGYLSILKEFCTQEDLGLVEFGSHDDDNFFLFITDDENALDRVDSKVKKCLISSTERNRAGCYMINKTFSIFALRTLFDTIHHGGRSWNLTSALNFKSSEIEYEITNTISDVERMACYITIDLLHICTFSEVEKIRVGLSEMITNAIEHGNLNITGTEKHEAVENGTFQKILEERSNDPKYKDKKVKLKMTLNKDELSITITDEGYGFDVNSIPSPTDIEQLLKLHGRGIFITRAYFTDIKYNDKGNQVTLYKKL